MRFIVMSVTAVCVLFLIKCNKLLCFTNINIWDLFCCIQSALFMCVASSVMCPLISEKTVS